MEWEKWDESKRFSANWEDHLGLVHFVLKKMRIPPEDWDDCFQEGMIALWQAGRRFKPEKGYQFNTYAITYIRGYVQNYHRKQLGTRRKHQVEIIQFPINADGVEMEFTRDQDLTYDESPYLDYLKGIKNPMHRKVFILHYQKGMTFSQIAEEMGIAYNAVRMIIIRNTKGLREKLAAS